MGVDLIATLSNSPFLIGFRFLWMISFHSVSDLFALILFGSVTNFCFSEVAMWLCRPFVCLLLVILIALALGWQSVVCWFSYCVASSPSIHVFQVFRRFGVCSNRLYSSLAHYHSNI